MKLISARIWYMTMGKHLLSHISKQERVMCLGMNFFQPCTTQSCMAEPWFRRMNPVQSPAPTSRWISGKHNLFRMTSGRFRRGSRPNRMTRRKPSMKNASRELPVKETTASTARDVLNASTKHLHLRLMLHTSARLRRWSSLPRRRM